MKVIHQFRMMRRKVRRCYGMRARWLVVMLAALLLVGCGGSYDDQKRQEFIDKCIIEAGSHADKNATDYCYAKWRQSQREK